MEELLRLARRLRPAVLDDHGLMPALHTQVRDFTEQTGIRATFHPQGAPTRLSAEQQLAIYRVTQEGLSNIAQHASAQRVRVELSFVGRTVLRDLRRRQRLRASPQRPARDGRACANARCWPEDICPSGPSEGAGTRVELTI